MGSFSNGGARVPLGQIAVGTGGGITGSANLTYDIATAVLSLQSGVGQTGTVTVGNSVSGDSAALVAGPVSPGAQAVIQNASTTKFADQSITGVRSATLVAANKPGLTNVTTPATWVSFKVGATQFWIPAFAN